MVVLPWECTPYKWFGGWANPEGRLAGCGLPLFIVSSFIIWWGMGGMSDHVAVITSLLGEKIIGCARETSGKKL